MSNRNKIFSDLSKFAVDAMSAFSGLKEEIETIVSLRVEKVIKKMNLVRKDEFDALKKIVQKLSIEKQNSKRGIKKEASIKKKLKKKKTSIKKRKKSS
ncbi:accessory factor UbiK family protein [Pelagibacteraceae bacterium]|nr:accessory factor UbiK family protein [Pelagibacteraceae bacterium]